MENLIQQYHIPDRIWKIWKADSYDYFIDNFMVTGKFHDKVPEKIINDYKIVERLLCYSYYHYPLLDEAFSKATRVFESAIKLRLKELGIPEPMKFESLEKKIKKIEPFTSPTVLMEWNKAREIRNAFAHPEAGSLMGIIVLRGFYQMVNIINTIFLDKTIIEENELLLNNLKTEALHLKEGLFKFEFQEKNFLVWSIIPYSYFRTKNVDKSFWVFHPVFTYFPQTTDKLDFSLPICLRLSNLEISDIGIKATILGSGDKIVAIKTDNPINIDQLKKHKNIIVSSEMTVKDLYWHHMESEVTFEVVKFLYDECWK
jgi:hypothetical protein